MKSCRDIHHLGTNDRFRSWLLRILLRTYSPCISSCQSLRDFDQTRPRFHDYSIILSSHRSHILYMHLNEYVINNRCPWHFTDISMASTPWSKLDCGYEVRRSNPDIGSLGQILMEWSFSLGLALNFFGLVNFIFTQIRCVRLQLIYQKSNFNQSEFVHLPNY